MVALAKEQRTRPGRVEDERLIQGRGRYSGDIRRDGQAAAIFVRSPYAHARIAAIDSSAAKAAPGVLDVITAEDLEQIPEFTRINLSAPGPMKGRGGKDLIVPTRPALARGRVRHVGEPVAVIVAETVGAAEDAVDLLDITYEDLPAVVDLAAAAQPGAAQIFDEAPGNIALDWPGPKPVPESEIEAAFASASTIVRLTEINQRIAGVPMEPRGATAEYDQASGRYTLFSGSQSAPILRNQVAGGAGLDPQKLHLRSDDVGGGFGLKTGVYPEHVALLAAARRTGRAVHWMSTRSEAFMSDNQARDIIADAELALDAEGRFLALRVRALASMGAYITVNGVHLATGNFARCLPTVYQIPLIDVGVKCLFTNTVPTGPYRGAGRPEANFLMERLVEAAARATGIDSVELRRRNLTPPEALPYETPVGTSIDSGDFRTILDMALAQIDYAAFPERKRDAARRSRLRGIGLSCFLEHAGAVGLEGALVTFPGEDRISVELCAHSNGQGHATVFRDLVAGRLGVAPDAVVIRQGDSDVPVRGFAAVASRSAMTVSTALLSATDIILEKGRRLAAELMEAAAEDVVFNEGRFEIAGTDRSMPILEVARAAAEMKQRGEIEESLDTNATTDIPQSFPNGCHIAEVEIDPQTGRASVVDYVAVDDCGNMLSEMIVKGQIVGALAQGLGQVFLEQIVYDRETGQLITGTFNDYAMPRAEQMPPVRSIMHPVPCRTNPLGIKGVGEAGTTASLAALMNAIADAIPEGRGWTMQMPATPEKVWRACAGLDV